MSRGDRARCRGRMAASSVITAFDFSPHRERKPWTCRLPFPRRAVRWSSWPLQVPAVRGNQGKMAKGPADCRGRPRMTITFTKTGAGTYTTLARRDDAVVLEVPSYDRTAPLPHDLAHYVV